MDMVAAKVPAGGLAELVVARRALDATSAVRFTPLANQQLVQSEHSIAVTGLTRLDGQYIMLVSMENVLGSAGGSDG